MNKIVPITILAALAAGGYYYARTTGMLGGVGLNAEAVAAAIKTRAEVINASGDVKYDDFSRLTSAKVDGMKLTVDGRSALNADQLSDDYIESLIAQARNKLCTDEASTAILAAGATYAYNWTTADGETIGTVTAGPDFCANSS